MLSGRKQPKGPENVTETPSRTGSPVTWRSLAIATGFAAGLGFLYLDQKNKKIREIQGKQKGVPDGSGRPAIGGPFSLIESHSGQLVTDELFRGRFMLVYFGFTHCPDVCPDELEKITHVLETLEKNLGKETVDSQLVPLFISIDPERDTPKVVDEYLRENAFHPRLIGLTGSVEQCAAAAKAYRVYYTKTNVRDGDYLVDHSIITYFMGPDGALVDYFGKHVTTDEMVKQIQARLSAKPKNSVPKGN